MLIPKANDQRSQITFICVNTYYKTLDSILDEGDYMTLDRIRDCNVTKYINPLNPKS